MSFWRISGHLDKDGNEVPFKTFFNLDAEAKKRSRQKELDRTNGDIRIRNEIRDRKDELRKKALEISQQPIPTVNIIRDLSRMIKNGDQYDGISSFINDEIIYPLIRDKDIEEISSLKVYDRFLGTIFPTVCQNVKYINPDENPSVICK